MTHNIKRLTKLQTFYHLLTTTTSALEDVDNYDLRDNVISQMAFEHLQEMQALRSITLINYITYNAELLIEELVSDITE